MFASSRLEEAFSKYSVILEELILQKICPILLKTIQNTYESNR